MLLIGAFCTLGWAEGEKKNVVSGLDVEFYAKIKADASWSDSRVTPGNYVLRVEPESGTFGGAPLKNNNDDEFNLTANATRFGFLINGPESDDWNFWGQLEFDLFGGSNPGTNYVDSVTLESDSNENRPELMTRHAFLVIERPADQWSILAGQTWDVVAPLVPNTLNYPVLWQAGNMGYRVPQVRFTKDMDLTDDTTLQLQIAVTRTIGEGWVDTTLTAPAAVAYEPGADEGWPTLQGRAAITLPGIGPDPITVGVSGHYGQEEYDYVSTTASVKDVTVDTWSGAIDLTLPLDEKVKVTGEIHTGANLGRYQGGIGTTIYGMETATGITLEEVRSAGGWIAVALGPWDNMCYNVGYGRSENAGNDADNIMDTATGGLAPRSNSCIFGNAIYNFNEHAAVGLELSWWETKYADGTTGGNVGDGEALVAQMSFIYKTR